jgi:hypothetical protein
VVVIRVIRVHPRQKKNGGDFTMRPILALLLILLASAISAAEDPAPIPPEEALKRVNQEVSVVMQVKSTGGNTARFLNSQTDFRSDKNFAVFIPHLALAAFQKAGIADPGQHFKNKTILVTGNVVLSQERPVLRVENPNQIKIVDTGPAQPIRVKRPAR